jgi:dipeptidase
MKRHRGWTLCAGGVLFVAILLAAAPVARSCFTIIVGKNASADGSVIMAHNEDDGGPQIVLHQIVPRRDHRTSSEELPYDEWSDLLFEQVPKTWAFIWSKMPGMRFSDSYLNEWGVCIASDRCPSREKEPGGVVDPWVGEDNRLGLHLRRAVAERAQSAREGVRLAGELVERYGYDDTGRTYAIADPDEGWLFCVVRGRHWVARRVPDDEVAVLANTYSVREVDLADTANFLGSADLISYAAERGWYDPDAGPFDFAAAYAKPEVAADSANFCRRWAGIQRIAAEEIACRPGLPFSLRPREKLDVPSVMAILRDRYEGTALAGEQPLMRPICHETTQASFIAHLRREEPLGVGMVYWVALSAPDLSVYVPVYFGATAFPAGYWPGDGRPTEETYQRRTEAPWKPAPYQAYWMFRNFRHAAAAGGPETAAAARREFAEVEARAFALQGAVEDAARLTWETEPTHAQNLLADFSELIYFDAIQAMKRALPQE